MDQMRAVTHRIVRGVPQPNVKSATFRCFLKNMNVVKKQIGKIDRWSHSEVINSYHCSRLVKRYVAASQSLGTDPLCKNDSLVKAFVKSEKFPRGKLDTSAPRLICSRSPRYLLELSTYLKPIDKKIRFLRSRRSKYCAIVKGLNQTQRASRLKELCHFSDYVIISLDAKKFDAHVSRPQLKAEHDIYLYCHNNQKELAKMLSQQLNSKGSTANVRFSCKGRRMSGDPNTSLGNNTLMFTMTITVLEMLAITEYELMVDGDDILVILHSGDKELFLSRMDALYLDLGHEMACGGVFTHWRDAVHCQTKIFGDRMIRHYEAIIGKMFISERHFNEMKHGKKILKTIAQCELALNRGVPVVQPLCEALLEKLSAEPFFEGLNVEGSKYRAINECGDWETVKLARGKEITDADRAEFELCFGLEIEAQIEKERSIRSCVAAMDFDQM